MTAPRVAGTVMAATLAVAATACGSGVPSHRADASPAATAATGVTATPTLPERLPPISRLPRRVLLHVPPMSQLPELPNGCEVTSLAMLLAAARHPVPKLTLARLEPRDGRPAVPDDRGFAAVRQWGNPEVGFVGSVTGNGIGYGIYHRPLGRFLDRWLPRRAVDLSGRSFDGVLRQVAAGRPVVVWATTTFAPTDDWVTWHAGPAVVRATRFEHAVLLVGYDRTHVYVNNPLTGAAAQPVSRTGFVRAWIQLGRQALSYR